MFFLVLLRSSHWGFLQSKYQSFSFYQIIFTTNRMLVKCAVSVSHCSPAVGSSLMLCCLHPWTTTTPSGRRDRSFPVLSTPTSWRRSSQLPGPKPPVNQILQPPLLLSLHLCPHHHHCYLVRERQIYAQVLHIFAHLATLFDDVFISDREDSPELPPPPGVGDNRQCVLCLKYGDENTNVSQKICLDCL